MMVKVCILLSFVLLLVPAENWPPSAAGQTTAEKKGTIEKAKAAKQILNAAQKGETFRLTQDDKIELVKVNIRGLAARAVGLDRAQASVDYSLYENHGDVEIGVEVLAKGAVLDSISARPVRAHPGMGMADFPLSLKPNQTAVKSDQLRFFFNSISERKRFYSRTFAFSKDWHPDLPPTPPAPVRRASIKLADVRELSAKAVEVKLKYAKGDEKDRLTLAGTAYDDNKTKIQDIAFSAPDLASAKTDLAVRFELKGSRTVHSKALKVELVAQGRTVDDCDISMSKFWGKKTVAAPATPLPPGAKLVSGTVDQMMGMDGWKIKGNDGVFYWIQMAKFTDYGSYLVGDRVKIVCPDAKAGSTSFSNCWFAEEGMKVFGTVTAIACSGSNPSISVQTIGTPASTYLCYLTDTTACQDVQLFDTVDVTGEPDTANSKTLRRGTLGYHYQPSPRKPTSLTSEQMKTIVVTEAAGWDILAQIHTDVAQSYIHDYYVKNPSLFRSGSLTISEPVLSLWGSGQSQACLRLNAKDGFLNSKLELYFKITAGPKELILDFAGSTCALVGSDGTAPVQSTGGSIVDQAVKMFGSMSRIRIPLSIITDALPSLKCLLPDGTAIILSDIFKTGIQLRPTSTQGAGYIVVGLSYLRRDMPNRNFGNNFGDYNYEFGHKQPIAIAVSNWILSGLVNEMFKPVKTFEVKPNIDFGEDKKIGLAIVDTWESKVENVGLRIHEAALDFYKYDIKGIPDCGEWATLVEWAVGSDWISPSMGNPGKPGYRCHTHGVRIWEWVLPIGLSVGTDKKTYVGFQNVQAGPIYDRSDAGEDFRGVIDAGIFNNIKIVAPTYKIADLDKSLSIYKIDGNSVEFIASFKLI